MSSGFLAIRNRSSYLPLILNLGKEGTLRQIEFLKFTSYSKNSDFKHPQILNGKNTFSKV